MPYISVENTQQWWRNNTQQFAYQHTNNHGNSKQSTKFDFAQMVYYLDRRVDFSTKKPTNQAFEHGDSTRKNTDTNWRILNNHGFSTIRMGILAPIQASKRYFRRISKCFSRPGP